VLDAATLAVLRREALDADGTDHFPSFVVLFEEEAAASRAAFTQAESAGDSSLLGRTAHKLRGAAANFGALHLQALCTQIERDALAHRISEAEGALAALRAEVDRVRVALAEERRRPAPPPAK
jgi:HPt (histidine-containing phosphotransfer) domain-containing protein